MGFYVGQFDILLALPGTIDTKVLLAFDNALSTEFEYIVSY